MNYRDTLDYLFSQLPMFHRIGAAAYKANLDNTIALCDLLDQPEQSFKSIHIAGTNGKGSVSHMIASVLQEAGYRTGLYTSPHLKDFRERIRVNGKMIPKSKVSSFVKRYSKDFEQIQPSFFEMTVGLAFDYFREQQVEIAVIETGLGGRLDSTNIITPVLSIITNIGFDHMAFLGDTLAKIAAEKAGIIKKNIPVIIGETRLETEPVFNEFARKLDAPIHFADRHWRLNAGVVRSQGLQQLREYTILSGRYQQQKTITIPLSGSYQQKNLVTVLESLNQLIDFGFTIKEENILRGLLRTIVNTGLKGRWQILVRDPLCICDTGHNVDGIREVLNDIRDTPHKQLHFVLGMANDKDIHSILQILPKDAIYYFCKANIPRGMDAVTLREKARDLGLKGKAYASVWEAYSNAKKNATGNDMVFVGGSTFVVAEVL